MSEDAKRAMAGKVSTDVRKSSSASSAKRIIVKSADMADDMQKEAIEIAIAVLLLSLSSFRPAFCVLLFPIFALFMPEFSA